MGENLVFLTLASFQNYSASPELAALHAALAILLSPAINAFNMIDGIDGLSASMALWR